MKKTIQANLKKTGEGDRRPAAISFTIPLRPTGQMRGRATAFLKDGRYIARVYKHKKQRGREGQIAAYVVEAALAAKWEKRSNAMGLTVVAFFPIPKSFSKAKRVEIFSGHLFPEVTPDLDNIVKQIKDVCEGILFDNDKRICRVSAAKFYGDPARARVMLWDLV